MGARRLGWGACHSTGGAGRPRGAGNKLGRVVGNFQRLPHCSKPGRLGAVRGDEAGGATEVGRKEVWPR